MSREGTEEKQAAAGAIKVEAVEAEAVEVALLEDVEAVYILRL